MEQINEKEILILSLLSSSDGKGENILGIKNKKEEVHAASGLNWGYSAGTSSLGDAYIPISRRNIEECKSVLPIKCKGENYPIDVIWDDGTKMKVLLEGNGLRVDLEHFYPKQVSTYKSKKELGNYIRKRIGNKLGIDLIYSQESIEKLKQIKKIYQGNKEDMAYEIKKDKYLSEELYNKFITLEHLLRYGRTDITVTIEGERLYRFDFSV